MSKKMVCVMLAFTILAVGMFTPCDADAQCLTGDILLQIIEDVIMLPVYIFNGIVDAYYWIKCGDC